MRQPVIAIDDVSAVYGRGVRQVQALRGVTLSVQPGEIFGLLGPNGAGKTTLLACVEGLHRPVQGSIRVAGLDVGQQPAAVKRKLGLQLQRTALLNDLTVGELLEVYAALYEVYLTQQQITDLLARFDLSAQRHTLARRLSGGQQQRLSYGQEIRTPLFTSGYASAMPHSVSCLPPRSRPYSLSREAGLTDVEREMGWKKLLSYITGSVDQELLLRNEYLVTENRMLRQQIPGRVRLTDAERTTLAEIGKKLGRQALEEVASIVTPDTILTWHRKFVAQKFDGSQQRKPPGRPPIAAELEALVVRMAQENRSWGYDRIAGALQHLGYTISDQTVGNILKRHGLLPAPERKKTTTWKEFIRTHMDVLVATDFFTAEVWTKAGLVTYYVLFFIHLASRKVHVAGVTPHPDERWMVQIARNVTMADWGVLSSGQYLIHDRDSKYCPAFQRILDDAGITRVPLPPRSPNLNAYAERWVRSVKEEALSRLILFGERSLQYALTEYVAHFHQERPHQGKSNVVLMPAPDHVTKDGGPLRCRERLGGLLKYYACEAA